MHDITPVQSQPLWWDPKRPEEPLLFDSEITLHEDFYQMLIDRPVPIDVRVLKDLMRSPLAIDLYCWLTYRASYLKHEKAISWKQLQEQFGAEYSDTQAFA